MSSTPRRTSSGSSRPASSRDPARVGIDPDRAGEDRPDRLERGEVLRAAELDLERREVGRAGRPLGDDRGLVDADREVGRRDVGGQAEQLVHRDRPVTLPTRSCSAMSIAHLAAPCPRMAAVHRRGRRPPGRPRRPSGSPTAARAGAGRRRPSSRASRRRTGPGSPPPARRPRRTGRRAARRRPS